MLSHVLLRLVLVLVIGVISCNLTGASAGYVILSISHQICWKRKLFFYFALHIFWRCFYCVLCFSLCVWAPPWNHWLRWLFATWSLTCLQHVVHSDVCAVLVSLSSALDETVWTSNHILFISWFVFAGKMWKMSLRLIFPNVIWMNAICLTALKMSSLFTSSVIWLSNCRGLYSSNILSNFIVMSSAP